MKKKILAALIAGFAMMMVGCTSNGGYDIFDTTWTYERAVMKLPNGEVIDGRVQNWRDYEGDVVQVKIDGNTYYVHMENIVLISEDENWDAAWPTMPEVN